MSATGGFVAGVLGLSLLEAVLSSNGATDRLGGAFTGVSSVLRAIVSPDVPAIPDLRAGAKAKASVATTPNAGQSTAAAAATTSTTVTNGPALPTPRLPIFST